MTQHTLTFLRECTSITGDGSLTTLDEFEGLYVYWCSLRGEEPLDTVLILDDPALEDVATMMHDGVGCLEGLVLTGPIMTDFILTGEFAGAWGHSDSLEFETLSQAASAY